jgi:hypothetical protein
VTYTEGAWEKGDYEYPSGRAIGGYGNPDVSDRYKDLSREAVSKLKTFPSLFVYEEGQGEDAYLGWMSKALSSSIWFEMSIKAYISVAS